MKFSLVLYLKIYKTQTNLHAKVRKKTNHDNLLCSSNDRFKCFKFCFLAFLGTHHGSLDSYELTVYITKL